LAGSTPILPPNPKTKLFLKLPHKYFIMNANKPIHFPRNRKKGKNEDTIFKFILSQIYFSNTHNYYSYGVIYV
jgi:hypothetical protein